MLLPEVVPYRLRKYVGPSVEFCEAVWRASMLREPGHNGDVARGRAEQG